MSDTIHLPTRAEFIRDRLAEHLERAGYWTEACTDGPQAGALGWADDHDDDGWLHLDTMGRVAATLPYDVVPRGVRGFSWRAVPADTGIRHGPSLEPSAPLGRYSDGCARDPYTTSLTNAQLRDALRRVGESAPSAQTYRAEMAWRDEAAGTTRTA